MAGKVKIPAGEKVTIELAQGDLQGAEALAHRRGERSFDGHQVFADDVEGLWGKQVGRAVLAVERPDEFDVIPSCNLTGDLISDALAAQVGGIGIAPGANINYESGHALFEATHGTAPKYAGQDKVNPGSVILSGEMMLRDMGWTDAADRIVAGLEKTIQSKVVTYDFARLMEGAKEVKCSEFGTAIIENMARL